MAFFEKVCFDMGLGKLSWTLLLPARVHPLYGHGAEERRVQGLDYRKAGAEKNIFVFPHGHPLKFARFQIPHDFVRDLDEL